jgi:hypothetical protein
MTIYDKKDRVDRVSVIIAGPLKVAAYRVRDPVTDEWSPLQFHMTFDNVVMALMGEESAKLFSKFVRDTLPSRQSAVWVADAKGALTEQPFTAPESDAA